VTESVFADLSAKVAQCFDAVSIQDMCSRAGEMGLRRPAGRRYVYVI
jgi:hypothetical protein